MNHLLYFYGAECIHCEEMERLIVRVEHDTGVTVDRREVWHNPENMKYVEEIDRENCGGIPYFHNTKTGKWICGEATYDELVTWAKE